MKADQIIKNAKIFTSDKKNLQATALVVKDGKFVYVGDEAGLAARRTLTGYPLSCQRESLYAWG
jgi:predicted amidohydrolase YtcJ